MTTTKKDIAKHCVHGAQTAVADEAGELILAIAAQVFSGKLPLETPRGRSITKLGAAAVLLWGLESTPSIPQREALMRASGLVIEAASRDLLQPELARLRPLFSQLAALGLGEPPKAAQD